MSRDYFFMLFKFFHLANNKRGKHDKLHKVREVLELMVHNWQSAYSLDQDNISIDESIIAFKGRSPFTQYMPAKPHKWGMKAWVMAESKTGYMYNMNIYQGAGDKASELEGGLAYNVVLDLVQPIHDNLHHIYMDNFFTSPALFESLADRGLGACGTLRTNRRGVPDSVKGFKFEKDKTPKAFRVDGKYLYVCWLDKKPVTVLSTLHNDKLLTNIVRCKDPANDNKRAVVKPMAVECYNLLMGGVDLADKKLQTYLSTHRTVKWWKKIFAYLLEVSFINSRIIWQKCHPRQSIDFDRFRLEIIKGLVQDYERSLSKTLTALPPRTTSEENQQDRLVGVGRHWLMINPNKQTDVSPSRPECMVCSGRRKGNPGTKRHQTIYWCKICEVPLCPYPCHEIYHTVPGNYQVACTKHNSMINNGNICVNRLYYVHVL
jgi:hypothetical protein